MAGVAYERWSHKRGSKYTLYMWLFDLETFGILEKWLLKRGARLREVAANGDSAVYMYRRGGDRSKP